MSPFWSDEKCYGTITVSWNPLSVFSIRLKESDEPGGPFVVECDSVIYKRVFYKTLVDNTWK